MAKDSNTENTFNMLSIVFWEATQETEDQIQFKLEGAGTTNLNAYYNKNTKLVMIVQVLEKNKGQVLYSNCHESIMNILLEKYKK